MKRAARFSFILASASCIALLCIIGSANTVTAEEAANTTATVVSTATGTNDASVAAVAATTAQPSFGGTFGDRS